MTLVVAARYLSLPQTQVAASALRSAGIEPFLFEDVQSVNRWSIMFALGGLRLAVRSEEIEDAVAILGHPPVADSDFDPEDASLTWPWRVVAALLGVGLLWPDAGWLAVGLACRRKRLAETAAAALLTAIITFTAMILITVVGLFLSNLLTHLNARACLGCT